jgi:hypothetical protein
MSAARLRLAPAASTTSLHSPASSKTESILLNFPRRRAARTKHSFSARSSTSTRSPASSSVLDCRAWSWLAVVFWPWRDAVVSSSPEGRLPYLIVDELTSVLAVESQHAFALCTAIALAERSLAQDLGERWPSRLVATAEEDCLSFRRNARDLWVQALLKRFFYLRGLKSLPTGSSSAPPQPIAEPQRIPGPTRAA